MPPGSSARDFPVRPELADFEREAEQRARADPTRGLGAWREQLAAEYGLPSWQRLVLACKLTAAIWRDDLETLGELIGEFPELLQQGARGKPDNWGPPMSYAANLGCDRLVLWLHGQGATDVQHAFERACLQGKLATARLLHGLGARPQPGSVMGPCETQNADGLALLLELGAQFSDEHGDKLAPLAMLLETYSRNRDGRRRCLELAEAQGARLPDTPAFAVLRGSSELLARHLARDPDLFGRTLGQRDIYPLELGCHEDESLALHGTPLAGATLLHLCVDVDELDLARWMLDRGAHPDARAAVDAQGFGGHTALFGCLVSQTFRTGARRDDGFARLLLDNDANPLALASLRKRLRFVEDETLHEYRDVTPVQWANAFHDQAWVNRAALRLVVERGGLGSSARAPRPGAEP